MSSLPDYNTLKSAITTCWDRSKSNNNWITFLDSIPKADNTPGAGGDGDSEATQDNHQNLLTFIANTGLVEILSEADIHASDLLSSTADRLGVKSWQLSEYVEQLKEELGLTSDQYIRYEKAESSEVSQAPEQPTPSSSSTSAQGAAAESLPSTTIDPAQLQHRHEQPKPQSIIPLVLTGIGTFLLVFIAVLSQKKERLPQPTQAAKTEIQATKPSNSQIPPKPNREETTTQNKNKQAQPTQAAKPEIQATKRSNRQIPPKRKWKITTTKNLVYFQGIDLPLTNKICNRRGNFCIYNLAKLVDEESGLAFYEFRETNEGKSIQINGIISISKIERINNKRTFTFEWEDDLGTTSAEYAATGHFRLDQDADKSRPGIRTRFLTTRSFGSKTSIGRKSTSYFFPR